MLPDIASLAHSLSISNDHLSLHGVDKAKVSLKALKDKPRRGRLILVSAITPTPAGEGKTTVSIGLAQGLKRIGQSVALALRQPSMGPVFERKGGAQLDIVTRPALGMASVWNILTARIVETKLVKLFRRVSQEFVCDFAVRAVPGWQLTSQNAMPILDCRNRKSGSVRQGFMVLADASKLQHC